MTYLLDSNVISFLLKGNQKVHNFVYGLICDHSNSLKITIVAYYEIKRGLIKKESIKKLLQFENYCRTFEVVSVSERTMDIAANIYASLSAAGSIIEDADIFIAATALEHDFTLLTNNVSHIGRIDELKFLEISQ